MSRYLFLFFMATSASFAAPTPNPTATTPPYLKAFDVSAPQSTYNPQFWNCTYQNGYQKVAMRGYMVCTCRHPYDQRSCELITTKQEAGQGSRDPNFQFEYQAATGVGYTPSQIDSYIFPCPFSSLPFLTSPFITEAHPSPLTQVPATKTIVEMVPATRCRANSTIISPTSTDRRSSSTASGSTLSRMIRARPGTSIPTQAATITTKISRWQGNGYRRSARRGCSGEYTLTRTC